MAAYDPKRPRPAADTTDEPAPVEALLDPAPASDADGAGDDSVSDDIVLVESVTDELLVDEATGDVIGERITTDDVVLDAGSGEVLAAEETVEQIVVDPVSGEIEVEASVTDLLEDRPGDATGATDGHDTDDIDDTGGEDGDGGEPDVEVDLRVVSSNGSEVRVGSDVPIAAAPEEGTANRAVVVAVGVAGLVAVLLAILLRRRRRSA